ncbi:Protein ECM3 [Termitomyces sp. T112]|nr:Protein ECM3 [Termitomyces sp. T112]
MFSAGQLIWTSCRPLIRLMLCVTGGFILTKTDNFPPIAARGAGQIALNIALPCLMFSKIVPAFTADNIHALGPLVLVAILYEAIGLLMAWFIKQFLWVPHRFRYGVLVAGGWGNVGDIPTSVIMSVTGAAPFNGTVDQDLSIAYISAFILIFMITLFPMGGSRLIAMDFVGADVEPEEVKEAIRRRRRAFLLAVSNGISWLTKQRRLDATEQIADFTDAEKSIQPAQEPSKTQTNVCESRPDIHCLNTTIATSTGSHVTFQENFPYVHDIRVPLYSPTPAEAGLGPSLVASQEPATDIEMGKLSHSTTGHLHLPTVDAGLLQPSPKFNVSPSPSPATSPVIKRKLRLLRTFASTILTPASITILLSFPIALIPPLKGLFTPLPASNSTSTFINPHLHPAPDGLPPLSIILDTTTFIGAASIPLGLIWAIASLAIGKMVITPILGVGIVEGLVKGGIISEDDKLLRFVCIFFSCLPTATTQVYLTQVFSGTGNAEHLPAFLIPQYTLMFISMTALTAYTLQLLF